MDKTNDWNDASKRCLNDLEWLGKRFVNMGFTCIEAPGSLSVYNWPLSQHPEPKVPLIQFYADSEPRISGPFSLVTWATCAVTEARIEYFHEMTSGVRGDKA